MVSEKEVFARGYYNRWAESYEKGLRLKFWFWRLLRKTWRNIFLADGAAVYDMGCGTGNLLQHIHRQYPKASLYGTDISDGMLEKARAKFRGMAGIPVNLKVGDMNEHLPWEDALFDFVITTYSFHHCKNPAKTLREVLRVLKPGGKVYVADLCYPPLIHSLVNMVYPRVLRWRGHIEFLGRGKLLRALHEAGFNRVRQKRISPFAVISSAVKP
jgi:ubiquinone/menaquinone biosynthesis C-methylase UbiE